MELEINPFSLVPIYILFPIFVPLVKVVVASEVLLILELSSKLSS